MLPFRISIHADAVTQLIDDASHGDRIYELFSIRRHGDIKQYLWVRIMEAAERIKTRYRYAQEDTDWPGNECHYPKWDNAFFLTWDEEPEECAWHQAKLLPEFKAFIDHWFDRVLLVQGSLRQSEDIFIQNEIRLIDSNKHDYEYETKPPFILTPIGFQRETIEDHCSEWFYEDLTRILGQPDINSVAYRASDLRTFRLLCTEQLKRCSGAAGNPKEIFRISLLDLSVAGLADNRFPRASHWGGYALYSDEGLRHGDLLIDMNRHVGYSAKVLVEQYLWHENLPLYILTDEDLGEIKGYGHRVLTSGFLYKKLSKKI